MNTQTQPTQLIAPVTNTCYACGSNEIEFHESAGHAACVNCGVVQEESAIVSCKCCIVMCRVYIYIYIYI